MMFKQAIVIGILTLAAALGVSCGTTATDTEQEKMQAANLTIRSPHGQVIATGTMSLPDPLPGSGSFAGTCDLVIVDRQFPAGAVARNGECQAEADGKQIRINLNPGVVDNNVSLAGDLEAGQLKGSCDISTFAGPRPVGSFVLRLKGNPQ